MATISHESALRKITIAAFLPSLPLVVASGIKCEKADGWILPGVWFCLIPTFFSAISSLVWVYLDAKRKEEDDSKKRTTIWSYFDFLLAAGHLAALIPVWVVEPHRLNRHADWMMLVTYATCFSIADMAIHAYLFLRRANKVLRFRSRLSSCPHCVHCHHQHTAEQPARKTRGPYSLLPELDDEDEGSFAKGRLSQEV